MATKTLAAAPASRSQSKAERIKKYGAMQIHEYLAEWQASQRDLAKSSVRHLDATQSNAFDKLKTTLLDVHRFGRYDENPLEGVKPPQYDPARTVIPSVAQLRSIRTAGDDAFVLIANLMSGCGLQEPRHHVQDLPAPNAGIDR